VQAQSKLLDFCVDPHPCRHFSSRTDPAEIPAADAISEGKTLSTETGAKQSAAGGEPPSADAAGQGDGNRDMSNQSNGSEPNDTGEGTAGGAGGQGPTIPWTPSIDYDKLTDEELLNVAEKENELAVKYYEAGEGIMKNLQALVGEITAKEDHAVEAKAEHVRRIFAFIIGSEPTGTEEVLQALFGESGWDDVDSSWEVLLHFLDAAKAAGADLKLWHLCDAEVCGGLPRLHLHPSSSES
jgi:hypothetical protein